MEGHTLKRFDHLPEGKCQVQCLQNPNCYSVNHKDDFSEGNCEINGATREMSPGSYRERLGWIYYAIKGRTSLSLIQFLHVLGFFCTKISTKALCPNRCNNYKNTSKTLDPLEN